MPVLPHIETSQLICCANQLTGFCMRATLAFNGLSSLNIRGEVSRRSPKGKLSAFYSLKNFL